MRLWSRKVVPAVALTVFLSSGRAEPPAVDPAADSDALHRDDPPPALPGRPPGAFLASPGEIHSRSTRDRTVRVLDARPKDDFEKGHIPDARWVDLEAAKQISSRPGGLEDQAAWEAWIAGLGLTPDSTVIIYDDNRQLDAARTWWLLRYLGVARVGLLDGGIGSWTAENQPLQTGDSAPQPSPLPVKFQPERSASREEVRKSLDARSATIVDVRSGDEFSGAVARSRRGGHIPEACHLEWLKLVDEQGRFLPPAELRKQVDALKLAANQPVIVHCQTGGRASVVAFALEFLGRPVKNYYAGWSDWGNREDTPIATEANPPASTETEPRPAAGVK